MVVVYAGLALLAGACLAIQVGVNGVLRARWSDPALSALASFAVGTAALGVYLGVAWVLHRGGPASAAAAPGRVPWWAWTGGILGASYILTTITFAPRLGAAGWVGVVVAGQIVTSVLLDHFGLLGFTPRPITLARVGGVALLVAGAAIVLRR